MSKIDKVLITGVAGFIGSHILDSILDETDWEVDSYDDLSTGNEANIAHRLQEERFSFYREAMSKIPSLKSYDAIFHLAALPRIQPSFQYIREHVEANLLEGVGLLEKMIEEEHFPRLIYSGSSAIYGDPEKVPTPETESIDPMNPYAFQKYELEKYLEFVSVRYPIDYVTLRYFNPFGPRSFNEKNPFNAYTSVVGIFLNRYEAGETLQITGDGTQKRDFVHVKDVARANLIAAQHPEKLNDAYNIGKGDTLSINDLAAMISDRAEYIPPRDGEASITHASIDKAKKVLGWEPIHELEDYIEERKEQLKERTE